MKKLILFFATIWLCLPLFSCGNGQSPPAAQTAKPDAGMAVAEKSTPANQPEEDDPPLNRHPKIYNEKQNNF